MKSTSKNLLIQEVYAEQLHIFQNYKPTDTETLTRYPSLKKEIQQIEALSPQSDNDHLIAIRELEMFNRMWFPDASKQEQENILTKLFKAQKLYSS